MNKIEIAIKAKESEILKFRPSNEFYKKISINKKRFWQIVRNEKSATVEELEIISKVLDVKLSSLL